MNNTTTKRLWIATPLMLIWLAGTVFAFWWFQARDLRSFGEGEVAVFKGDQLAEHFRVLPVNLREGEPSRPLVVHFWNPGCNCNKFNNPHVRDIVQQYRAQGVNFLTVVKDQADKDEQTLLAEAESLFNIPAVMESKLELEPDNGPSATPAAAVINPQGELAYYGPYSDSAFCAANGSAFVEKTLDKLLAGKSANTLSPFAFGCFCQWQPGVPGRII